MFNRKNVQTK